MPCVVLPWRNSLEIGRPVYEPSDFGYDYRPSSAQTSHSRSHQNGLAQLWLSNAHSRIGTYLVVRTVVLTAHVPWRVHPAEESSVFIWERAKREVGCGSKVPGQRSKVNTKCHLQLYNIIGCRFTFENNLNNNLKLGVEIYSSKVCHNADPYIKSVPKM